MDDELKNKLNEFLGTMIDGMEKAGEFAVDQIPDVVQQALTWFAVSSGVGFGFGLLVIIASAILTRWTTKDFWVKNKDGSVKVNLLMKERLSLSEG